MCILFSLLSSPPARVSNTHLARVFSSSCQWQVTCCGCWIKRSCLPPPQVGYPEATFIFLFSACCCVVLLNTLMSDLKRTREGEGMPTRRKRFADVCRVNVNMNSSAMCMPFQYKQLNLHYDSQHEYKIFISCSSMQ